MPNFRAIGTHLTIHLLPHLRRSCSPDRPVSFAPHNYRFPRLGAPPVTDNCSPFVRAIRASSSREAHRKINRVFDPNPARRRSIQSLAVDEAGGRSESDQFPNRWLSHSPQSSRAPHRIVKNEDSFGMTAIDEFLREDFPSRVDGVRAQFGVD